MKSATIPSLRVDPELRSDAESVLQDGETLSSFVEKSIRNHIRQRRAQHAFIAKGLAAKAEAERTGEYFPADDVIGEIDEMLYQATERSSIKK